MPYRIDVADRLFDYKNKHEMAIIEETRRQVDAEIKMQKQTPRISDKSKFIEQASRGPETKFQETKYSKSNLLSANFFLASSITPAGLNDEEVVNRLMQDAKRRQAKIMPFQSFKTDNFDKDNSHPNIQHDQTGESIKDFGLGPSSTFDHTKRPKSPNVVSRLYEWGKGREDRLKEVRDNYLNNYSFTPRINEVSKIMIELDELPKGPSGLHTSKR